MVLKVIHLLTQLTEIEILWRLDIPILKSSSLSLPKILVDTDTNIKWDHKW